MAGFRKLKLIGDGTSVGIELVDAETGENILQRYAIAVIRVETTGASFAAPKVTLELHPLGVDVEIKSPSHEMILDILDAGSAQPIHMHDANIKKPPAVENAPKA